MIDIKSSIKQLQILAPIPRSDYDFHPEIKRVSEAFFRDGQFKSAVLEAFIRVIEEVKIRPGLDLDGDSLMNQAFSFDFQ